MPYLINRTSGSKITTVQDGTIDTISLDITLVGKNYIGYGEAFNENFVKMLENFAGSTNPAKPLSGQLWYDSANRAIKFSVDSKTWKPLGVVVIDDNTPTNNKPGDLWFRPTEGRLFAYPKTGNEWILVGPISTRASTSGALEGQVLRVTTGSDYVLKMIINGKEQSIISSVNVSVNAADASYASFPVIKKGITFPDLVDNTYGVSYTPSTGGNILWGTSASALGLVRNNGVYYPADSFLLQSQLSSLGNSINLQNDDGILIGTQGVMRLHVTGNTGNITIYPQGDAPGFKINVGGAGSNVLSITTGTSNNFNILPTRTSTVFLGTDTQRFSFGFFNTLTATTVISPLVSATSVAGTTVTDNGNRVITSVTVNAGTGLSGGGTIVGPFGTIAFTNTGVLSLQGTTNQVSVSASTGDVTLTLPQNINSTATVTFNRVNSNFVYGGAVYDNSNRVLTSANIATAAITSISGTSNQVSVATNSGAATISLPQNIATNSNVQFGNISATDVTFNKILVGTATGGSAGDIRASGDVTAFATSDRRYKENVRDIPSALSKVDRIGGKLFDWTDEYISISGGADGYYVRKNDVGVIAQDVQDALPEAVRTKEDGTLAVDYPKLCALAFAAIKELKKEIDELKSKVQ